jgi:hypothetical protein
MDALQRKSITIRVNLAEFLELDAAAKVAGLSVPQHVRTRLGLSVRWTSNPNTEERDHEEDDAWERLLGLGLDPKKYFPDQG